MLLSSTVIMWSKDGRFSRFSDIHWRYSSNTSSGIILSLRNSDICFRNSFAVRLVPIIKHKFKTKTMDLSLYEWPKLKFPQHQWDTKTQFYPRSGFCGSSVRYIALSSGSELKFGLLTQRKSQYARDNKRIS